MLALVTIAGILTGTLVYGIAESRRAGMPGPAPALPEQPKEAP